MEGHGHQRKDHAFWYKSGTVPWRQSTQPLPLQSPTRNQQGYGVPKIVEALRRDQWGCFQKLGVALSCDAPFLLAQ